MNQVVKEVSLLFCIPQNKFQARFATGLLSLQETIYAHVVWIFTGHFLNRLGNFSEFLYTMRVSRLWKGLY